MTSPFADSADNWDSFARIVGVRLQKARLAAGLSQEEVAYRAGIAVFTYQKMEAGQSRPGFAMNPRMRTIAAVGRTLKLPIAQLLEGVDEVHKY